MRTWLTSDWHLGQKNILKKEKRPFKNLENMHEAIKKNWNTVVEDDDTVIMLGDVSTLSKSETSNFLSELKGRKILVRGNHDRQPNGYWINLGFSEVYNKPIILIGQRAILSHKPLSKKLDIGDFINYHGHLHSKVRGYEGKYPKKYKCVSIENVNYTPILINSISL